MKVVGNTPSFNEVKNQLSTNFQKQQQQQLVHEQQEQGQKSPKISSNFEPEQKSSDKIGNHYVRNKLDPSASPHKPKGVQPRVRTGLDSKPKYQVTNNRIPRTKNGELGDFAVLVEQDGDGFQMRYNVVGIQKLNKKGIKKTNGKEGFITQQGQTYTAKKSQNPRQTSYHQQRGMKNTVSHQPSNSMTYPSQFNSQMRASANKNQPNIQKNRKKQSSSVHLKKPSIYEMPLKISTTTSPTGYKTVKNTTTAAICSPANNPAPPSQRSACSSKGATPTSNNNRSIAPSSSSNQNSGSQISQKFMKNSKALQKHDLNNLQQLQKQLRKKLIEYSGELSSSYLRQLRNIQKPAPQLVKVLEIFCGLASVVQFSSGTSNAWIKRPKSWNSIQATLSSPSQFIQNCRKFKELCEQDQYDYSKISALSCQFQKIEIKNVPNIQFQPIYFIQSFTKAMLNYVTIREHMKKALQQQDIESHVYDEEDSFSQRKEIASEDEYKNSKSSLTSSVLKFKSFEKSPNTKGDQDIISISQSMLQQSSNTKILGRQSTCSATARNNMSQSFQEHQQRQSNLKNLKYPNNQKNQDVLTDYLQPSESDSHLDDQQLQQSVQRMKQKRDQEMMSQVSNASSNNHSKITSKEAERNLNEQQTKIQRFVSDKHKRHQERGMISFESPRNFHSTTAVVKDKNVKQQQQSKPSSSMTLFQNYQKKGPVVTTKRTAQRLNQSAIDIMQTSNNNIFKGQEHKRKKTPADLNRSFNHQKLQSSQKLNLYSTKKNLEQKTLRSNSKSKLYSATVTTNASQQYDIKKRSVTPKLLKQKCSSNSASGNNNYYSSSTYKKNPARATGTATRMWNRNVPNGAGLTAAGSNKNIKIDSNLSIQSSKISTPSQKKLNSCKNASDKKHNFMNYNSAQIKSSKKNSHIKSPSISSKVQTTATKTESPAINSYK